MDTKKQYKEKIQAKIQTWNAEIEKLQAKAKEAQIDAQVQYEKQIEKLERLQANAEKQLHDLQESSESAWDSIKESTIEAWNAVEQSMGNAIEKFRKK